MVVWLPEFHSTHVLCGMPGEAAATAAMKAICDAGAEFTQCDLVLYYRSGRQPERRDRHELARSGGTAEPLRRDA